MAKKATTNDESPLSPMENDYEDQNPQTPCRVAWDFHGICIQREGPGNFVTKKVRGY
jgi:hypothetical protein